MHSRIFELVKVEEGADYNSYMQESDFYDCIPYKFDYVNDRTDLAEDIDWLRSNCEHLFVGEDTLEISIENRRAYFKKRFEKLKEIVAEMTLDVFATGHNEDWTKSIYDLKSTINEEYGFYVYCDETLDTFDDFVRYYFDGQYKIVGSMDYHW